MSSVRVKIRVKSPPDYIRQGNAVCPYTAIRFDALVGLVFEARAIALPSIGLAYAITRRAFLSTLREAQRPIPAQAWIRYWTSIGGLKDTQSLLLPAACCQEMGASE